MKFSETFIDDLILIEGNPIQDERGFFIRNYCRDEFKKNGFSENWVQTNLSFNNKKGTLRGMHFQIKPYEEDKLIRCVQGSVFDVAVDLRENSKTFLKYFGIVLSFQNNLSLLIPKGFAHGFLTLEDSSSLIYFHSEFYNKSANSGFNFEDPTVNINWPDKPLVVSQADLKLPYLNI
jgi:dTDP-4-dehydrorhamnose 3,5-epimerase